MIKTGNVADIVVFNPDTIRETATFSDPHKCSKGIEYLLVNGVLTIEKGVYNGNLPGKAIRLNQMRSDRGSGNRVQPLYTSLFKSEKMLRTGFIAAIVSLALVMAGCKRDGYEEKHLKRAKTLEHLVSTFSSDVKGEEPREYPIWESWLRRTGELPPDFDELQANAFPPDLLSFSNGSPVEKPGQWPARVQEIREILDRYMFGKWPPSPPKIAVKYDTANVEETDLYTRQNVQLYFAPSLRAVEYAERVYGNNPRLKPERVSDRATFKLAILNVDLFIPKGKGPFPAIIEIGPSNPGRELARLKRGYMVALFSRLDADYIPAVYTDYECNQLEWWAYAACRCIDLLYARNDVDTLKIAMAGHSRGAKTALLATIMDSRVKALINSHPGTGAGSFNLWRYAGEKNGGESLDISTHRFPYWNNPRMRFFVGRENKMPFDNHFLQAMIAPVPTLMGTGEHDDVGEPWGDQLCYLAVKKVYKLLGKEENLGFYASPGAHQVTPDMIEGYLDWLDMQFGRKPYAFENKLIYTYSFDAWKNLTGEDLNINGYPKKGLDDILLVNDGKTIKSKEEWENKTKEIIARIKSIIGELPEYDKIQQVALENERKFRNTLVKADLPLGNGLTAHLTWPVEKKDKIAVVIYLHGYLDANGYNWAKAYGYNVSVGERIARNGFLAVEFDQFGYGLRNRDAGIEFFTENKNLSALGAMVSDVCKVIDAVGLLEMADQDKIVVAGYSLGGLVGLYAAAFDPRIMAVASACGFGSMRLDVHGNQTEGIRRYSHLRPTIPRLGLFLGNEERIPYDFHEVLGLIAPRPVFVLAPKFDQDWFYEDVEICCREAEKIYDLYGKEKGIAIYSPDDFNRYPPVYQEKVNSWITELFK